MPELKEGQSSAGNSIPTVPCSICLSPRLNMAAPHLRPFCQDLQSDRVGSGGDTDEIKNDRYCYSSSAVCPNLTHPCCPCEGLGCCHSELPLGWPWAALVITPNVSCLCPAVFRPWSCCWHACVCRYAFGVACLSKPLNVFPRRIRSSFLVHLF